MVEESILTFGIWIFHWFIFESLRKFFKLFSKELPID